MATLDLTCLRSLVAVGSFAGVRRAAEVLHLSQAAVSGHLRRLEAELGFAIVMRQGRNVAFTERGEEVLREAYRLVTAHDDAIARLLGPEEGELVVASVEYASEPMLRAVVDVLRHRYPGRGVRLRFHRSARLRELVHERRADVAIGLGDLGPGTETIGDVELSWLAASDRPADVTRLVVYSTPCVLRDRIFASDTGRRGRIVRECIDLTALLTAVREGAGITALPGNHVVEPGVVALTELPPLPPFPLTVATSPRIDATTRSELTRTLRDNECAHTSLDVARRPRLPA